MAYLSPEAMQERRRMTVPQPSFWSRVGEALPGVGTRGVGTVGGAALGAALGGGPIGAAAGGALAGLATEPAAQGLDTAMQNRLAGSTSVPMGGGGMSPLASSMAGKQDRRRRWGAYLGGM